MPGEKSRSPKILHISWGKMEVDGVGAGKDFKLYLGGGREWDWSETGTRHVPGIQPADVVELLKHGSEVIVLSRGMDLVLQTCPETLEMLKSTGIPVHVEETRAAVGLYNRLAETKAVGGLSVVSARVDVRRASIDSSRARLPEVDATEVSW